MNEEIGLSPFGELQELRSSATQCDAAELEPRPSSAQCEVPALQESRSSSAQCGVPAVLDGRPSSAQCEVPAGVVQERRLSAEGERRRQQAVAAAALQLQTERARSLQASVRSLSEQVRRCRAELEQCRAERDRLRRLLHTRRRATHPLSGSYEVLTYGARTKQTKRWELPVIQWKFSRTVCTSRNGMEHIWELRVAEYTREIKQLINQSNNI